jgi:hypothetical protein
MSTLNESEDIFKGLGVEVELSNPDAFLLVKETLGRIGILSKKSNTLSQTASILHKKGRYRILHFKELFLLDGKTANISEEDLLRRNRIAYLLDQWNLIKIYGNHYEYVKNNMAPMNAIKIIPFKDKKDYVLKAQYTVGKKHY